MQNHPLSSAPDKEIPVEELYSFSVTRDTIQTIYRAASAISAPFLRVVGDGSQVSLSVGDPNTPKKFIHYVSGHERS